MNCAHGKKGSQCAACYRELAQERGRKIRAMGVELGAAKEKIAALEQELAQAREKAS